MVTIVTYCAKLYKNIISHNSINKKYACEVIKHIFNCDLCLKQFKIE